MANDYSQFQGSDYYHIAETPKQNNLLDGLAAALQTFAAIRGGKKKIDQENADREQRSKLLGYKMQQEEEDRAMRREEFGMKKKESEANIAYRNKLTELHGSSKTLTEEQKENLIAQTERIRLANESLTPGSPEHTAGVEKMRLNNELLKRRAEETASKTELNKAKATIDPKTNLPTTTSRKGSGSSTGYIEKHDKAFEKFSNGASKNKTQEKSDTSMTGTVEMNNPKFSEYIKTDVGREQALEAYEALEQAEKEGEELDPTQKRIMATLAELLKLQTEEQLPESPLFESVNKFERSKMQFAEDVQPTMKQDKIASQASKPNSLLELAKDRRVSLSSPIVKIPGAEAQSMPIDDMLASQSQSQKQGLLAPQRNFKKPETPNMLENEIVNADSPNVEKAKEAWKFTKDLIGGVGEEVGKVAEGGAKSLGKLMGQRSTDITQKYRGNSKESIGWVKSIDRNTQGLVNEMNKIVNEGNSTRAKSLYKKYVNSDGTSYYLSPEGIKTLELIIEGKPVYEADPVKRSIKELFGNVEDLTGSKEREAEEKAKLEQEQAYLRNKNSAYLRGKSG